MLQVCNIHTIMLLLAACTVASTFAGDLDILDEKDNLTVSIRPHSLVLLLVRT